QFLVLGDDRGHAVPSGVRRLGGHPVHAVLGEEVDVILPAFLVEELRLPVEKLLDRVLRVVAVGRSPRSPGRQCRRRGLLRGVLRRPLLHFTPPGPCTASRPSSGCAWAPPTFRSWARFPRCRPSP